MEIDSFAFSNGWKIPEKYTIDGEGISPPLHWRGVPKNTKSLTLIVADPDVPHTILPKGELIHWMVVNIPPFVAGIMEGADFSGTDVLVLPNGTVLLDSPPAFAKNFCPLSPPDKEHRYFFDLYALDSMLEISPYATYEELIEIIKSKTLAVASLMGVYGPAKKSPQQPLRSISKYAGG